MDGGNYDDDDDDDNNDDDDDDVGNPFPHWDPSFMRPPGGYFPGVICDVLVCLQCFNRKLERSGNWTAGKMDGGNYDDDNDDNNDDVDDDDIGNPFPHWDPSFMRPPGGYFPGVICDVLVCLRCFNRKLERSGKWTAGKMDGGNYDDDDDDDNDDVDDDDVGNPFPHWDPSFMRPPAASLAPRRSPLPLDQGEQKTLGRSSGLRPVLRPPGFLFSLTLLVKAAAGAAGLASGTLLIIRPIRLGSHVHLGSHVSIGIPFPHWDPGKYIRTL